jgi:hypothetical protein
MATARDCLWPGGHAVDRPAPSTHTAGDIMSSGYPRRDGRSPAVAVRFRRRIHAVIGRLFGHRGLV